MDSQLREGLARTLFRLRKIAMPPSLGGDMHMREMAVMHRLFVNPPCSLSDIHDELYISRPAFSQILGSLERRGFIRRDIDRSDHRKIIITITPAGHDIMDGIKPMFEGMLEQIIRQFGEDNTWQLIGLFDQFADIAEEIFQQCAQKE